MDPGVATPFVMTAVFVEEGMEGMDVVEGTDVSCSCVGDPRVLGTRERRGVRLPVIGVVEVTGVEAPPVVMEVVVVAERGREWEVATREIGTLS